MEVEQLIAKYINGNDLLSKNYIAHVHLVSNKAVQIANRLGLERARVDFVYEAAMLHDIGIIKVNCPDIGCFGDLPYIQHLIAGEEILRSEGLNEHALVARRHCTPSLSPEYVRKSNIPLPIADYRPQTIEEKIICFADQFSSKGCSKTLNGEYRTLEDVIIASGKYGEESQRAIWDLAVEFGEIRL